MDQLNQRAQELIKQADASNHNRIDNETAQLNGRWTKKLTELEANIEQLNVLSEHWQDFDKRIALFENQLTRLDERCQNVDTAIKSKQQLDDTKAIYQVSESVKYGQREREGAKEIENACACLRYSNRGMPII